MQKIGIVEKVEEYNVNTKAGQSRKTNITIEGMIYSKWGKAEDTTSEKKPFKAGDKLLLEYEVNGIYNNIKEVSIIIEPKVSPPVEMPNTNINLLKEIVANLNKHETMLLKQEQWLQALDNAINSIEFKLNQIETLARNGGEV